MFQLIVYAQILAVVLLLAEGIYVLTQKPSKTQLWLLMIILTTLIMMIGYLVEITAGEDLSIAMSGASMSYIGKPYAMLFSLLFISEYCGRPLSNKWIIGLSAYCALFPVLLYTNRFHHLYYATVSIDPTLEISKLSVTRGPLYYLYMISIIITFSLILAFTIREYRSCTTRKSRGQALYLFGIVFSSVLGYLIYLTGITNGYDSTMLGSFIGVVLLMLLFIRYRIFDSLMLAKDRALDTATNGFLVLGNNGRILYSNNVIHRLLECGIEEKSLRKLAFGNTLIHLNDRVFEAKKTLVVNRGRVFGNTVELSDITERFNYSTELEKEVEQRAKALRHVQRSVISSFAGIVEARDNITGVHVLNVARYVEILARSMAEDGIYTEELTEDFITRLVDVSPLHDIGKLSIADSILLKEGPLTPDERAAMQLHTVYGAQIAVNCLAGVEEEDYVKMAEDVAHFHHERWNGEGYPTGLRGEQIPLAARITAVADVYDAIRSERSYKSAMTCEESRKVIEDGRGTFFDPNIVDAFIKSLPEIEAISKLPREHPLRNISPDTAGGRLR